MHLAPTVEIERVRIARPGDIQIVDDPIGRHRVRK